MLVEARDTASGDTHYFDVNFAPKNGGEYLFMWLDGTRRVLQVHLRDTAPAGTAPARATLDIASHEVIVQTGR